MLQKFRFSILSATILICGIIITLISPFYSTLCALLLCTWIILLELCLKTKNLHKVSLPIAFSIGIKTQKVDCFMTKQLPIQILTIVIGGVRVISLCT